jgi:multimeric flavodoxin WrbA
MKISIINGSQKSGESNTGIILNKLNKLIKKDNDIVNFTLGIKQFSEEIYGEIVSSDVIIFSFPLYTDSIPSNMLKMLIELEDYFKKSTVKGTVVYTIINNGFYEGRQTSIAFEIMRNWCERSGVQFCGGIGQGAGEMIGATKNKPIHVILFNNLQRTLESLVEKMEAKDQFGIKFLSPSFPRFLWKMMATYSFWHPLAYKNKIKKKDIIKKL